MTSHGPAAVAPVSGDLRKGHRCEQLAVTCTQPGEVALGTMKAYPRKFRMSTEVSVSCLFFSHSKKDRGKELGEETRRNKALSIWPLPHPQRVGVLLG